MAILSEYNLLRPILKAHYDVIDRNQKCKYLLVLVSPESTPKIVTFTARNNLKS